MPHCGGPVRRAWILVLVCGLMLLDGAGVASPAPAPVSGGTLTIAFPAGIPHVDTNAVGQSAVIEITSNFYERLFERDRDRRVRPHLVRESQASADGLAVTWRLQPNVRFHDGSVFNAAAVKWNLDRKIQKRQTHYSLLPISRVDVVDDMTVRVTLVRPAPELPAILTLGNMAMYSPTFAQRVGDDGLRQEASGTGPFILEEFRPNQLVRLKRNQNYWQRGLPYLDEIAYRIIADVNTRSTILAAGDVDMTREISSPDIQRFKNTRGIKVLEAEGTRQYFIDINNRNITDVRVRRALNHAVDKEGIIKAVLLGAGRVATAFMIGPKVDGYVNAGSYAYQPERARALLDEAGWKVGVGGIRQMDGRPLRIELVTRKGSVTGDFETAELVHGMLRAVGVDVRLTVADSGTYLAQMNAPGGPTIHYDLAMGSNNTFSGDAAFTLYSRYRTADWPPAGFNYAHYSNPQVDRLLEDALRVRNLVSRDQIYFAQVIKQVMNDAPAIMLFDVLQHATMKNAVNGVYIDPGHNAWTVKHSWKAR